MTTETILTDKEISKTLVDAGILLVPQEITAYDITIARSIEQAVLQSPEIQVLRKDAVRWRAWRKANVDGDNGFMDRYLEYGNDDEDFTEAFMDASLDAAMEQQI